MDERGQDVTFPGEPVDHCRIPDKVRIQQLHCEYLARRALLRTPDSAIRSTADELGQFVLVRKRLHDPGVLTATGVDGEPAPSSESITGQAMVAGGDCRHNTSGTRAPDSSTRRYRSQEAGDVCQQVKR
jgi:hypothetical protein